MRTLLPFLACLMLAITSLTSIAHATETPDGAVSSTEMAAWHAPGDADEVPGDSDKATPHHHSICHGHDLATPVRVSGAPAAHAELRAWRLTLSNALTAGTTTALLRPPIS